MCPKLWCNNTRLGVLDEQFARCGPEALLRRFYGIRGREKHESVNVFERGSAGGHRVDLRGMDKALGIEVALGIENGQARQMREIIFVEQSGKTHHLPIRDGTTPEQLRAAYERLGVVKPCADVRLFCDANERTWVEKLMQAAWPDATFGRISVFSSVQPKAVRWRGTRPLSRRRTPG